MHREDILRTEGFSDEQIYPLAIGDNPAQMLLMGRIDAWFNGVPESLYIWPKVSKRKLLMSKVGSSADLYLACSKQCSPKKWSRTCAKRLKRFARMGQSSESMTSICRSRLWRGDLSPLGCAATLNLLGSAAQPSGDKSPRHNKLNIQWIASPD
nr:hypothetical protein GCM10020185_72920 [Pseudomonas brassicacearum subsp. brassicacearum]